jgi:hypothetical protein
MLEINSLKPKRVTIYKLKFTDLFKELTTKTLKDETP